MGILDWLKGTPSNVAINSDLIWLTKQAKFNAIAASVACSRAVPDASTALMLVAHFPDCLADLKTTTASGPDNEVLIVVLAEELKTTAAAATNALDASQTIQIIVGERHPLVSHDQVIVDFVKSLPCRSSLVFHVSLEDPLMKAFTGEWVQNILEQLGMQEHEAIESRMVTRRILKAQMLFQRDAVSDLPAASAEEWLHRNCPDLGR